MNSNLFKLNYGNSLFQELMNQSSTFFTRRQSNRNLKSVQNNFTL